MEVLAEELLGLSSCSSMVNSQLGNKKTPFLLFTLCSAQAERLYDFVPGMELIPSFHGQLHRLLPKAPVVVIYRNFHVRFAMHKST